ncbi:alpha/beta fold hydrolase, partial [Bacteroides heparinolyticus]
MPTLSHIKSLIKSMLPALFLMSALLSCARDEPEPFEPVEYEKFAGELFSKTVRLGDITTEILRQFKISSIEELLLGQGVSESEIESAISKINLYLKLAGECEAHGITYHTTDPDGKPIIASGVLYYPKSGRPKGVIEVVPWFKSKSECGTANPLFMAEIIPGMSSYVHIVPDQVGYGSTADAPIGYLQYENVAVVSADMRKAAEEFVYNHYHQKLHSSSILFGYSLGGGGALSLARYYGQHPERGVKVDEIFIGGGVYDPLLVLEKQFETYHAEHAVFPNIICSWNHYEDLRLDFSKVFKGKLLENYQKWCYGQYTIYELTDFLGTNLHTYFTEEFLQKEDSPEYQSLLQVCRQKRIPNDWQPTCRIHLFHGENDMLVPAICTDQL